MKLSSFLPDFSRREGQVVAHFGQARLIKTLDCRYELRGGSREDHLAAQEWISLFMHEVVVRRVSGG